MRLNQTIELSLRSFTLRVRQIEKFDTTEEFRDLTKNKSAATSGSKKKIFTAGSKSAEKYDSGYEKKSRAKPGFLLG